MDIISYSIKMQFPEISGEYSGEVTISISSPDKILELDSDVSEVEDVLINGHEVNFKIIPESKKIKVNNVFDSDINLYVRFKNRIGNKLNGIYFSGNEDNRMITTDLEPKNARSVFPCFDDPGKKARFTLTVVVPPGYDVISNTSVDTEIIVNGLREIKFHSTPKMATYLFYLGIGKMEEVKLGYKGKEIILSAPGQIRGDANFALKVAADCLLFYENYFGQEYSLNKLHLIAIPDFAPGAMENWGAITFRESKLLLYSDKDMDQKREIVDTIAHEIAHQWFGNLVTLSSWSDLWLNESFATLMAEKCASAIYPELGMEEYFVFSDMFSSMFKDSLKCTHPVGPEVSENEFEQIFDEISYGKGASVLRMIEHAMGEENFKEGISKYLKKKQFENGTATDLWYFLNTCSGDINIPEMAQSWISKPGFPIINLERKSDNIFSIRQRRFLLNGKDQSYWILPLFLVVDGKEKNIIMNGKDIEIEAQTVECLNRNMYGYYLAEPLNLNFPNRNDKWTLALEEMSRFMMLMSGQIELKDYISFLDDNSKEFFYPMFMAASTHIRTLFFISDGGFQISSKLSNLLRKMLQTSFTVRDDAISFYVREDLNNTLAIVDWTYSELMGGKISKLENIPGYEQGAAAIGAARSSINFYKLSGYLKTVKNPELYSKICYGIAYTNSKSRQIKILSMLSDGRIKSQEAPVVLYGLITNHRSRKLMLLMFGMISKAIRNKFGDTGAASLLFEYAIPYLGLVDRQGIEKKIEKYGSKDSTLGVKSGMELLEIYSEVKKRLG